MTAFPGWKRPGLIEARIDIGRETKKVGFPGWKRPGLIEAAQTMIWTSGSLNHFRGGNAPASLKRGRRRGAYH